MLRFFIMFSLMLNAAHAQRLNDVLSMKKKTFTETMPKDVVEVYEQNVKDMKAMGIEKKALKVGDNIPEFKLSLGGKEYSIRDVYERGPLVLKFYRGGWCGYCMAELKHYNKMNEDFKKAGAQILAISPDTQDISNQTRSKNGIAFDLLSDPGHAIAKQFGLVYDLDSKVAETLKKSGVDLAQYQGDDKADLSVPATYVVTKEGKIAFSYVDADYRKRAEPAVVLDAVKKLNQAK